MQIINEESQDPDTKYLQADTNIAGLKRLFFHNRNRSRTDHKQEILQGLLQKPRYIASKFLYDSRGAQLFDKITELPEYYLTRSEHEIFHEFHEEIATASGRGVVLIEPGSGSSEKAEMLMRSLQPSAYVPLEITESHLRESALRLIYRYPWLRIHAICSDYCNDLELPPDLPDARRLIFFPGSTIGNFEPASAHRFLTQLRRACGPDGALLIGVDLHKEPAELEAAYDDSSQITAAFNLNILEHINRILQGNFNLSNFRHRAFFNENESRVEMHLECCRDQRVTVAGNVLDIAAGETIHTENSYKYSIQGFQNLALASGFRSRKVWCDKGEKFSVHFLEAS